VVRDLSAARILLGGQRGTVEVANRNPAIVPLLQDPTTGGGVNADRGDIGIQSVGGTNLWQKTGPGPTQWTAFSAVVPPASSTQAFIYVASGAENPAGFPIGFPDVRPDTNYLVTLQTVGVAAFLQLDAPSIDFLTNQFTVVSSAAR